MEQVVHGSPEEGIWGRGGGRGGGIVARCGSAILVLVAIALFSCSGEARECAHSGDCGDEAACIDGRCELLFPPCVELYDCPAGRICFEGRCHDPASVGACSSDDDCRPGEVCNELVGECVQEETGCTQSADCGDGLRCENGRCVSQATECSSDSDCERPFICGGSVGCVPGCEATGCGPGLSCNVTTGRCVVEAVVCLLDADCDPPWMVCESPDCVFGCRASGCPDSHACDPSTGRCFEEDEPACRTDSQCEPPHTICEPPDCLPGCIAMSCLIGQACDPATGRCRNETVLECRSDSDCDPPLTVCESEACVLGCIAMGCALGFACDPILGRCEEETAPGCGFDTDCLPPDTICESFACVEGCLTSGCQQGMVCDETTGRCAFESGALPLGSSCEHPATPGQPDHEACEVDHCVMTAGQFFCADPCSSALQCPSGFTCQATWPDGSMACLAMAPNQGSSLPGAYCNAGSVCKSGWCLGDYCTDVCQHDRDCASLPGTVCRFFFGNYGYGEEMVTVCASPNYSGWGDSGDPCWGDLDCWRGNCTASGRCADPCHTSYDCPTGFVCNSVSYFQSFRRACIYPGRATGQAGVGTACDPGTDHPCRSLWCLELGATPGEGVCIDTCGTQADCPAGYRCEIVPIDATGDGNPNLQFPLCLPR